MAAKSAAAGNHIPAAGAGMPAWGWCPWCVFFFFFFFLPPPKPSTRAYEYWREEAATHTRTHRHTHTTQTQTHLGDFFQVILQLWVLLSHGRHRLLRRVLDLLLVLLNCILGSGGQRSTCVATHK